MWIRFRLDKFLFHAMQILFLGFLVWALFLQPVGYRVLANELSQSPVECNPIEIVFQDLSGVADVRPASAVTDSSGTVHLFWLYRQDREDRLTWTIQYTAWTPLSNDSGIDGGEAAGNWFEPVDVLVTPGGGAGAPVAVYTLDGRLHVAWADNRVWYASVPVLDAGNVRAWSHPRAIGGDALHLDLAADLAGQIHMVYSTGQARGPIYYLFLKPGADWSVPSLVSLDAPADESTGNPQVSVDGRGRIHVTWMAQTLPDGWPPNGQWYTRSIDGGLTWEPPFAVGVGEQGDGTILSAGEGAVHLVWRGTSASGGTYHRWSDNGGATWSPAEMFDPDGGFSGVQSLAIDSAGALHLVRSDGGYQTWANGRWDPVPALFADSGETGTLVIGLGNQVHWINTTPSESSQAIVWHRLCRAAAPASAPQAVPTTMPSPTPILPENRVPIMVEPIVTATPPPGLSQGELNPPGASVGLPMFIGVLPVIVLVFGVMIWHNLRQRTPRG
jgi:hypothetical protein